MYWHQKESSNRFEGFAVERSRRHTARWLALVRVVTRSALVTIGTCAIIVTARACDTPVYRYAMYNWAPSPFRVYYFYRGQPDKKHAEANRLLAGQPPVAQPPSAVQPQVAQPPSAVQPPVAQPPSAVQPPVAQPPSAVQPAPQAATANVVLETVDTGKKEELDQLPEPVRKAWEKHAGEKQPIHLVFTSWGDLIAGERLDAPAVRALVQSPLRTKIAQSLSSGHAAVFLLFAGKDAAATAQAQKAVQEAIAQAAKGRLGGDPAEESPSPSADSAATAPASESQDPAPTRPRQFKIGLVTLQRTDPAEKWLIQTLLTVERDMPEVAGLPMVFPVFGRGRVLAPCIGKGITVENLCGQLEVVTGPCSCTVRAQNPGVDLLFCWDWDATAEAMAREEQSLADQQAGEPGGLGVAEAGGPPVSGLPTALVAGHDPSPAEPVEEGTAAFSSGLVWRFGLGFAVIAAGVAALGLVLVRKRRDDTP